MQSLYTLLQLEDELPQHSKHTHREHTSVWWSTVFSRGAQLNNDRLVVVVAADYRSRTEVILLPHISTISDLPSSLLTIRLLTYFLSSAHLQLALTISRSILDNSSASTTTFTAFKTLPYLSFITVLLFLSHVILPHPHLLSHRTLRPQFNIFSTLSSVFQHTNYPLPPYLHFAQQLYYQSPFLTDHNLRLHQPKKTNLHPFKRDVQKPLTNPPRRPRTLHNPIVSHNLYTKSPPPPKSKFTHTQNTPPKRL